jgi:acetylornithine aminotransferase/acetylornithine/N-succinyldiaminopimelate aminotransferase
MRDIVPAPPAVVRNEAQTIQELFRKNVIPTNARFEVVLKRGEGSQVWDVNGKRYLDLGGGIAVCALGHAHPEITQTLVDQARMLDHVSNLYYHEPQGRLAQELARRVGPGKIFFCNSGAEANEGLFKLARRFGHDEGRFEILTAQDSFHGRTLAGIAATGQAKVKKGFGPMVPGFRHIPFNDLAAARAALSPATAAILVEGVQGEIGVVPAEADYLLGLRQLCDEKKLLLLMDGVQSRVSSEFWRGCTGRRRRDFCPMELRWPNHSAAVIPWERSGCGSATRICWTPARTARLTEARRWPARWG